MSNLPKVILNFSEVSRSEIAKVGGKGANLGELTQLGVPVPPGFIVSVDAYYYFLDMSSLNEKIKDIIEHTNVENNEELNKASSIIEELFIKSKLPPQVEHEVTKAYSKLSGFSDALVAVRSSATAEDLPDASFAGQQSTYLNIKGKREVILALKAAWASLFEPRAIYYRHLKGFDHIKVGIAVPVQKMIQSEVSGIMFTLDPITNDISKITIEAVLGLGEAIVGGEITPDHYVLDKESLSILEKTISTQDWMLVRKPRAKLIEELNQKVAVSSKWQNAQKLDDRSLVTLANIGRVIESHYGFPQDMEWAIEKGKLWIVQSRPVTTIKLSEQDTSFEEKIFEDVKKAQDNQHTVIPEVSLPQEKVPVNMPSEAPVMEKVIKEPKVKRHIEKKVEVPKITKPSSVLPVTLPVLLSGSPASVGNITGKVRVIIDQQNMNEIQPGEILVTEMTNPSWLPVMKIASAIITNYGGMTSHAAIVSRELGIPSIVGTQIATRILKTGEIITVDGGKGIIYEGGEIIEPIIEQTSAISEMTIKSPIEEVKISSPLQTTQAVHFESVIPTTSHAYINSIEKDPIGLTNASFAEQKKKIKTATKVYVNLGDPDLAEDIAKLDFDGVGLLRSEFLLSSMGVHPQQLIEEKKEKDLINFLAENITKACRAFEGKPVIYRATDFKTNVYRNLRGGDKFEPHEENPMLGFRGTMRYLANPNVFNLELEAIKIVRNKKGFKNLSILIPFIRTIGELKDVKKLISASDLKRSSTFKVYIMVEVPSNVILIEDFLSVGVDGIAFGSNDLTQLTLGIDRDNVSIQAEFDEKDPALLWSYERVITACHKYKVTSSLDGEAASKHPDLIEKLVKLGITSVSVNPDIVEKVRETIAGVEKELILKKRK